MFAIPPFRWQFALLISYVMVCQQDRGQAFEMIHFRETT